MKLAYYPGCSIHATAKEYEKSAKIVMQDLGFELEEIKDWNCCGAVEVSAINYYLSVALPARTFSLLMPGGSKNIIMLCNACYQAHAKALNELSEKPDLKKKIEETLGRQVNTTLELNHLLYYIDRKIGKEKLKEKIKHPLLGFKVFPYYGCSIARPSSILKGDDPNFPHSMEDLLTTLGAEVVSGFYKTKCCGGTAMLTEENISMSLTGKILLEAKNAGADFISVVCPLCSMALENASLKQKYNISIVYFTQLMGIAFGHNPEKLGLKKNLVMATDIINKIKIKV